MSKRKRWLRNPLSELYAGYVDDPIHRRSLNLMILACALGTVLFSISGGSAFTGLAGMFGANDFVFGLLYALPVAASVIQLFASWLIEKTGKDKAVFFYFGIVNRAAWLVVAVLPFIIPEAIASSRIWFLVVLVTASSIVGTFVNAGFYSFFSAMIPMPIRGKYISLRASISTACAMITGFAAAYVLDHVAQPYSYSLVFGIASLFGIADVLIFRWVKTPPMQPAKVKPSLKNGIKIIRSDAKVRNYLLYWALWSFAVNIVSPFITRFNLDIQGLTFTQLILFGQIPNNIIAIFMLPVWGRILDRYGSKAILFVTGTVTSALVLIWLPAVPGGILPLFIVNSFGALFWCGNDVCTVNMLISHAPDDSRSMVQALYFIFNAIPAAIAFSLGGALLQWTAPFFENLDWHFFGIPFDHYRALFILSFLLRLVPVFIILPKVWNEKDQPNSAVITHFLNLIKRQPALFKWRWRAIKRKFTRNH